MENNKKQKKTNSIIIRISDDELEFLKQVMLLREYTNRSEFIIDSIIKPQYIDKKKMRSMIYEVNKIGVNIMQVARYCNTHKELDNSVLSVLSDIKRQNDELLKVYKSL
jgi:hypothetical protein